MTDRETYERFWEEAVILLLHPTQLLIIEALARLEFPVSASVMVHISDGTIPLANFDYHLKRLETLELVEVVERQPRRGVSEKFFDLRLVKAE